MTGAPATPQGHSERVAMIDRLPPRDWLTNSLVLDTFLEDLEGKGLELYPAQEEAILALYDNHNVILNTPTGSGKSLVATALHLKSLAWGSRSVYTCPIKALVNEKFLALCREFGPRHVGMITGDSSVNPDAPILCCTAEILANMALRYGDCTGFDDVVMDEFHYYSDRERGAAWQIPLLTMSDSRFLLMSATLGETAFFQKCLTGLNGLETDVVRSAERPVPLDYLYSETPLHETVQDLVQKGQAPIYLVHFTQSDSAESAQSFLSVDFASREDKQALAEALKSTAFDSPYGKDMARFLRHGVGLHHAGLLPKYRILVERLAQQGLLKVICGTDTLGVGVNVPIRTVTFKQLCKYDGEKTIILSVRDFQQIAGRAGRRGFDTRGTVVVQAPEHVVENLRAEQKAAGDPKKMKKLVKKKPPLKGFLPWNRDTFDRLVSGEPEALVSRFTINHGILLNVLSRPRNGIEALRRLIRDCHESDYNKKQMRKLAFVLVRTLVDRSIIEIVPKAERLAGRTPLRVNVDLQDDFSLNEALSLYLVDTCALIPETEENEHLRLLSLVEAIQENPDIILRRQLDRIKKETLAALKEQGMDYEDRIAELEKLEYPKPDADFIYQTFNTFESKHPWMAGEAIRPKSIAREMYENFHSFDEYIREYDLQRSEGVLLRYLSSVYRTLSQTIPDPRKTDELRALEDYFGALVRDVDSSLLDEWRRLGTPGGPLSEGANEHAASAAELAAERERTRRRLIVMARNGVARFVKAFSKADFAAARRALEGAGSPLHSEEALQAQHQTLTAERGAFLFHQEARSPAHLSIEEASSPEPWRIEQTLIDESGFHDARLVFYLDTEASLNKQRAVLKLSEILG